MLTDTHAHLDFFDDPAQVVTRAKKADVKTIINVGTSVDASKKSLAIAEKFSDKDIDIYATVGIHPQDGKDNIEKYGSLLHCFETLKQVAQSSRKVVGVGECGLDYYFESEERKATSEKEKEFQRELFGAHLKLAANLNLPILIHCRNGWDEMFNIISNPLLSFPRHACRQAGKRESRSPIRSGMTGGGLRGLFHSWTGDWKAAQKALDLGFYISFSGILTFKNAPLVQEVAKRVPADKMLVETDSPFLSPTPLRGRQNEPENVKIVAQFLADLRKTTLTEIEAITSANAKNLFSLNG